MNGIRKIIAVLVIFGVLIGAAVPSKIMGFFYRMCYLIIQHGQDSRRIWI